MDKIIVIYICITILFSILYLKYINSEEDVWKDTPVRYFGYSNEIGESIKNVFPSLLKQFV